MFDICVIFSYSNILQMFFILQIFLLLYKVMNGILYRFYHKLYTEFKVNFISQYPTTYVKTSILYISIYSILLLIYL